MSTDIHRNRHWSCSATHVLPSMQSVGKELNTMRREKVRWHNCHWNWAEIRQWNDSNMWLCGNFKGKIFINFATLSSSVNKALVSYRNETLMLNIDFPINRAHEVRKNRPDVAWYFELKSHTMMEQLNLYKFVHSKLFAVRKKEIIYLCIDTNLSPIQLNHRGCQKFVKNH